MKTSITANVSHVFQYFKQFNGLRSCNWNMYYKTPHRVINFCIKERKILRAFRYHITGSGYSATIYSSHFKEQY